MEHIDWTNITREAGDRDNIVVPMAVDYNCPYCDRSVHFKMGWTGSAHLTYVCKSNCSGCKKSPVFIYVVEPGPATGVRKGELYIYPVSKKRKPFTGLNEIQNFSPLLLEDYHSAIRIFNSQEWIPAGIMCRRILEGLMRELLPKSEHNKKLYKQILVIDEYKDLKQPIKNIADVLRIAGNKSAHFDPDTRPNRETLTLMLDLIDYLIEYFFVLPGKTKNLRDQVIQLTGQK